MQGMGIIHHMELVWTLDRKGRIIESLAPAQPTVAFDASPETEGESCRDPIARMQALAGTQLGEGLGGALREAVGGPLGCSHLVTLALFMHAAIRAGLSHQTTVHPARSVPIAATPLFRRDLVFDAHEISDGNVEVLVRLGDLHWNDAPPDALAPDRFASLHELAARVSVHLWPGELRRVTGEERTRTADRFAAVAWEDRCTELAALEGLGLARGASGEIARRLGHDGAMRPWRDAFLMLAPALVQCRAAHGDAWHEKVRGTPRHPGLTAIPDSCYMWRRGGALERVRERHGAGKGGR